MKAILFCSIKGGVGKTTCADEMAYSLERTGTPFEFIDLDSQQQTNHDGHADADAEVVIVDTPARMAGDTFEYIQNLEDDDVVVIVTRATPKDLDTLQSSLDAVRARTNAKVVFAINQLSRYTIGKQFTEWFKANVGKKGFALIPTSDLLQQADALDQSVIEYAPKSSVASGVHDMVKMVRRAAGLGKDKNSL